MYSTLIAIVLGVLMQLSSVVVEFCLFYDGPVEMQQWALLMSLRYSGGDPKANGPLVRILICVLINVYPKFPYFGL